MNHDPLQQNWKRYDTEDDLEAPSAWRAWSIWAAVSVVATALATGDWWMPRLLEWLSR